MAPATNREQVNLISVSVSFAKHFLSAHCDRIIHRLPSQSEGIYFCYYRTFGLVIPSYGSFAVALICFQSNHITVGELLFFSSSSSLTHTLPVPVAHVAGETVFVFVRQKHAHLRLLRNNRYYCEHLSSCHWGPLKSL